LGAPSGLVRAFALVVATGAGAGYSPFASGTAGSVVGLLLFWPLASLSLPLYGVTVVGTVCVGIWAAEQMCRLWNTEDDGRIVIDEIAGQLITLAPLLFWGRAHSIGWVVTGFVLFRCLDVWKPGPVRWLDQNVHGGLGVVLDDVLAGVFGAVVMAVLVFALGQTGEALG
jgi:phosphatidylglycerophosphatase A